MKKHKSSKELRPTFGMSELKCSVEQFDDTLLQCFVLLELNNHKSSLEAISLYRKVVTTKMTDSAILSELKKAFNSYIN
jgi:hypothetical protein